MTIKEVALSPGEHMEKPAWVGGDCVWSTGWVWHGSRFVPCRCLLPAFHYSIHWIAPNPPTLPHLGSLDCTALLCCWD